MGPVDQVTVEEEAAIVGYSVAAVRRRVQQGLVPPTRAALEEFAADIYPWRDHVDDPTSYWVTSSQAAEILGVVRQRVRQLSERDLLPYIWHRD